MQSPLLIIDKDKQMIYARKALEKNSCIIYLAADIKCLDYHTPCSLVLEAAGGQYTISCGDVLLFRNKLRPYLQNTGSIRNSSEPVFCSEETSTYIRREGAAIYLKITAYDTDDVICEMDITPEEFTGLYKAIDLRWYNRTLPVYD